MIENALSVACFAAADTGPTPNQVLQHLMQLPEGRYFPVVLRQPVVYKEISYALFLQSVHRTSGFFGTFAHLAFSFGAVDRVTRNMDNAQFYGMVYIDYNPRDRAVKVLVKTPNGFKVNTDFRYSSTDKRFSGVSPDTLVRETMRVADDRLHVLEFVSRHVKLQRPVPAPKPAAPPPVPSAPVRPQPPVPQPTAPKVEPVVRPVPPPPAPSVPAPLHTTPSVTPPVRYEPPMQTSKPEPFRPTAPLALLRDRPVPLPKPEPEPALRRRTPAPDQPVTRTGSEPHQMQVHLGHGYSPIGRCPVCKHMYATELRAGPLRYWFRCNNGHGWMETLVMRNTDNVDIIGWPAQKPIGLTDTDLGFEPNEQDSTRSRWSPREHAFPANRTRWNQIRPRNGLDPVHD